MRVLELFSGIGGISLGLERAGMTIAGHVENGPFCQRVLKKWWPEVPLHDDVRTAVEWWRGLNEREVDVVAGGYPCQGESAAGLQRGTEDERWLWPEMADVIYALRPRWVIGENVAGHRTKGLRFVLEDLRRLGYTPTAGTIRACDLGAPHQRKRIFVVAYTEGERRESRCGSRGQTWRWRWESAGSSDDVADANSTAGGPEARSAESRGCCEAIRGGASEPGRRGSDVADTSGQGLPLSEQERKPEGSASKSGRRPTKPGMGGGTNGFPAGLDGIVVENFWADGTWEEGIPRVLPGVPDRVPRLRALGNAVVPQVSEYIGRIVMRADKEVFGDGN